jgi:hypothetical protein
LTDLVMYGMEQGFGRELMFLDAPLLGRVLAL